MKKKPETILIFSAHNDDQILGAGGTLVKYAKEGKYIISIIFSFGESSHIWLKPKEIIETRVNESKRADKILGIKESIYLGLKEGNFQKQVAERNIDKKIKELIQKYKPIKIFTHSIDDPHPDHQAVHNVVLDAIDKMNQNYDVYTFTVWSPIKLLRRNNPKLVVDISKTLNKKVKAFQIHKSQKVTIISLLWSVYIKAFFSGLKNKMKYSEVFYKVR